MRLYTFASQRSLGHRDLGWNYGNLVASDFFFFPHEKVNISDLHFLPFSVSLVFLLSAAVTAYCLRPVSICLVIKMVLAVQRSCPMLISNVCFLGTGIKRNDSLHQRIWQWLLCHHHHHHHVQRVLFFFFFKPLELGWINVYRRNFFMVAEAVAFHFFWCYSHPLRSTVGSWEFLSRTFSKDPTHPV